MDYTINQLATMSGVTERTLRFYDEINLLKPAFIAENGYRYYQNRQLLLLQQILFFRELGFELKQIQEILGKNDFDQMKALESQKKVLKEKAKRTRELMNTIDKTINYLKGKQTMSEQELFFGLQDFSPQYQTFYRDLMEKHPTIKKIRDDIYEKTKHLTTEDRELLKTKEKRHWKKLLKAFKKGIKFDSDEAQQLAQEYVLLTEQGGCPMTKDLCLQMKNSLNKMVERFEQIEEKWPELEKKRPEIINFLKAHPEVIPFMEETIKFYAEKNLK